ncbi:STAS domain-containing protein [Candidatus Oscillochloris fontis]|uniref:STAS domain-containing protein n=1 Tax=Candidatus Oscillochloris fontis TaxID=2496868 RepID=UPI00101CAF7B|nr:STAS domain-containing protein [Candidatus Oscillochloris fontis]
MNTIALTQRQINLGLLIFLSVSSLAQALIFVIKGGQNQIIAFGIGGIILLVLCIAYWRGWEPARYLAVITVVGFVASFLQEPFLSQSMAPEIFLPPVVALILAEPIWVVATGVLLLTVVGLRTGGETTYLEIDNLITYMMVVVGMVLSRLSVDTARRLSEANERANQARVAADQRAEALAQRNEELHALLVENAAQRNAIRDLTVPLLPIADQVLVLPLVGTLDNERLGFIEERALKTIHERHVSTLIIDLTGITVVDTDVARRLIVLVNAVNLLGTQVLLAGIRSEVAQTLVELRIDFGRLTIVRDIHAALAYASNGVTLSSL